MSTDPAVRSIRVATTLNERFGMLLRGMGGQVTVSELELQIGEAQQIYPEIWRHLDEGRAELAGRGRDVSEFDRVRATVPLAKLGVTTVELIQAGDDQIKQAQFNIEGFRSAQRAIKALSAAMPEVDWKAQAAAEAREIAAVGSLSPMQPKKLAVWAAVLAGAALVVYGFWFFLVRQEKKDWAAINRRERAERLAKIEVLKKELDQAPCSHALAKELDNLLFHDVDTRAQRGDVKRELRAQCKDHIAALEATLVTDPCDKVAQKALSEAVMGKTGSSDAAMVAAEKFRSQCAIGAADKLPSPPTP